MPLLNADMNGHDGQDEASPDDTNWSTFPLPDATEPIAIIGLSTKFPQDATTTGNLWHLLLKGRSAWGEFPADRINPSGHYHPDPEHGGTFAVKGGHFLAEDPAYFDAPFFSTTRSEVLSMDPQQRMVLESVYQALENAGLSLHQVSASNTSVFVSGFNHDHLTILNTDPELSLKYKPTGASNSLLANRVSWFFNLVGPSVTLDTACSSSMVAMHLACQSLACGESDLGLVAGVTIFNTPVDMVSMSHHGFLGRDGRCYSFDHRAEGYARGEGAGTVVVKRLRDALRDGDVIRSVIRGTASNQDGRTAGIALPSATAQESLIRKVYKQSGLDFADTRMVESHGTGTAAGDPLEASAIAKVFAPSRSPTEPMLVGAIKSVIGHMEGAAGIAGIIKGILILESGIIPPNQNFEKANPRIPMKKWNIEFPLETMPWPAPGLRRISMNSFGVGGSNAHIIVDDAYNYLKTRHINAPHNTAAETPTVDEVKQMVRKLEEIEVKSKEALQIAENGTTSDETETHAKNGTNGSNETHEASGNGHHKSLKSCPHIFPLSSFDEGGIERSASNLIAHLNLRKAKSPTDAQSSSYLDNLAYTLSKKRDTFPWRSFAIADSLESLANNLKTDLPKAVRVQGAPKIGFVFTGQGSQWYAMGQELMVYPIFQNSMKQATEYFQSLGAGWSLLKELTKDKESSNVNEPWLSHPACVALQMALVGLLRSWGIVPARVVGHSSGEIAAAYAASRLSQRAAWKAAYWRGYVSAKQLAVKGTMMAVGLPASELQQYIDQVNASIEGELVISCFNSPANQTVAGDVVKVDALKEVLDAKGDIFARKLAVKNAYHSSHMREVSDEYLARLSDLDVDANKAESSSIELFSSVTGQRVSQSELGASYWVDNMVSPVRFHEAVTAMCFSRINKGQASLKLNSNAENIFVDTLLEVGPHGAMRSAVKETLVGKVGVSLFNYKPLLSRTSPGLMTILEAIGFISSRGTKVNLHAVNTTESDHKPQMLVDLPPYSFHHTDKNVAESRLSKNYRLRQHPRHDLFGAPVPDWNAEFPRWRNIIRISEQPWLKDHVVTNIVIFPGVGYLTAVIEASLQIADPEQTISGFRLRDVSLKRALVIPESKEGVEVMLALSRMDEASLQGSAVWKRFAITSYDPIADGWVEHCTGYVATDYKLPDGPIDEGLEAREDIAMSARHLATAREKCTVPVDMKRIYEELVTAGIAFGPTFRNLSGVHGTADQGGEAFGTVTVPDVTQVMPKKFTHPHLIHPATMDSFMHLFLASVIDGTGRRTIDRAMIPTFMKEVWVSANVNKKPSTAYLGHGKSTLIAYDKFESDVTIWDGDSEKALVSIKGIRGSPLDSAETAAKDERKLCHIIITTPDPDLITKAALKSRVENLESPEQTETYRAWLGRWQLAAVLRITDALEELETTGFDVCTLERHFVKYYEWMKQVKAGLDNDEVRGFRLDRWKEVNADPTQKAQLYEQVEKHGAKGELAMRMGSNIAKVFRKEVDPLHLMFGLDDVLDRVYSDLVALGDLPAYNRAFLDVVARSSTNLQILEVGAGVGSSTVPVLEALAPVTGEDDKQAIDMAELRVSKYTFTDISSRFFEKARTRFKAHQPILEFKTLNAEVDGEKQGFTPNSYDYIFAGNVVHATKDLRKTLSSLRKLLKPGGKLVLQEGVRHDDLGWGIAFGQLPGWWLAVEPDRKWSPWIPIPSWENVLKDAGFSGIELNLADREDAVLHSQSIMVATSKNHEQESRLWEKTFIVTSTKNGSGVSKALQDCLTENLKIPECNTLHYLDISNMDVSQAVCISVIELEREVLSSPTEDEFNNVRQLLATCGALLWVTGDTTAHPQLNMITGLLRTVRWERDADEANLAILSVRDPAPEQDALVASLTRLFTHQFVSYLSPDKANAEMILEPDGNFVTSRIIDADAANDFLFSRLRNPLPIDQRFADAGRPIKLATASPGQLDKLQWVTDDLYDKPLGTTEVEIAIKGVGLNFRDLIVAMGEHMAYSLGYEAAGEITRIGPGVTKLQPGDRVAFVCGIAGAGCFQTYGRSEEQAAVKIPEGISFEVAAGLICVYSTVIYGLDNAARLQKGETILIHAAAGGVGQAAIHYAKYVGAEIYATVSTPEKRDLLINEYGIPVDHIFSSRDTTFVKGIMRMTNNRGVDVVLNSLAGELLRRSWDLVAPFGRFVEIGKKDAQLSGRVGLEPFLRNVTMTSVELPTMMKYRPQLLSDLIEKALQLYKNGHIGEARPTKVMSFAQISEGFRTLQSGKGMGKMVFVPNADDVVPVVPLQPPRHKFEADASYVLAGGLGGIGRSLARWMADKGASHLIFLSRSGKLAGDAVDMVTELKQKGCETHVFACDVGDAQRMQEVLEECRRTLPPIKGCIQGSMVLQDKMFENMTHEMYMAAVSPKVRGSWNLHNLLPKDLDFFVLLSSAAGVIGNRSQANYNAGNAFQDALTRHRLANGLACSAIDLGTVLSVGYVAENQKLEMMTKVHGAVHELLREEEIQHFIEYLMNPRSQLDQTTAQLVSGVTPAANFRQAGMPVPTYLSNPLFTHLRAERTGGVGSSNRSGSDAIFKMQAQLAGATTMEEAAGAALEGMRAKLSSLLATPVDNINPSKSVSSNGIDSLIAMEFRAFLVKDLGADIPLLDIMGTASVQALSVRVASASKLCQINIQEAAP